MELTTIQFRPFNPFDEKYLVQLSSVPYVIMIYLKIFFIHFKTYFVDSFVMIPVNI
jgi:hypothetical protein